MTKYLERLITDNEFKLMKAKLANKRAQLNEQKTAFDKVDEDIIKKIAEIGKLLKKPSLSYRNASNENKRRLVRSLVENFGWKQTGETKSLTINWKKEFEIIADRNKNTTDYGDALVGSPTGN